MVLKENYGIITSVCIPDRPSRSMGPPIGGCPVNLNGEKGSILSCSTKVWLGARPEARTISATTLSSQSL